jgi:membrane associated rhomboid family serine protease
MTKEPHRAGKEGAPGAPQRKKKAYFIILISIVDVIMLIYEIIYNKGIEPFAENPWLGPSLETLIDLGAKYAPKIKDDGEWWRFITPIFLHVGIFHLIMNLIGQLRVGKGLEEQYGTFRIIPVYCLSGIFGNLTSAIFLPAQVQVGASGALFGFLGVLLSDLIQNWSLLKNPLLNLCGLIVSIVIALAIGLLPGVDNFAHIGGFIMGIITGFIFLPNLSYGKSAARCRVMTLCACIPLMLILFVVGFIVFYSNVDANGWCEWCANLNCVGGEWCDQPNSTNLNTTG